MLGGLRRFLPFPFDAALKKYKATAIFENGKHTYTVSNYTSLDMARHRAYLKTALGRLVLRIDATKRPTVPCGHSDSMYVCLRCPKNEYRDQHFEGRYLKPAYTLLADSGYTGKPEIKAELRGDYYEILLCATK